MSLKGMLVEKLQTAFGDYVEGITANNLKMQVMAGLIEQRDLRLRPEALDGLALPITVKAGYLGLFSVKVPWAHLSSEAVIVTIENLYLLAVPNHANADAAAEGGDEARLELLKAALVKRLKRVAERELLRQAVDEGDEGGGGGMAERLGRTVLNNLQVTIRNVHARFEAPALSPQPGDDAAAVAVCVDSTDGGAPQRFASAAECVARAASGALRPAAVVWAAEGERDSGVPLSEIFDVEAVQQAAPEEHAELGARLLAAIAGGSARTRAVATGVVMRELHIHTIDEQGNKTFQEKGTAQNKEVRLCGLEVYSENPPPDNQLNNELQDSTDLSSFFPNWGERRFPTQAEASARQYVVRAPEDIVLRAKLPEAGTKVVFSQLEGLQLRWEKRQHEDVTRLGQLFASLQRAPVLLPGCLGYRPAKRKPKAQAAGGDGGGEAAGAGLAENEIAETFSLVDDQSGGGMSTFKAGTWAVDVRNVATGMRALNLHASEAEIAALLPESQAKFGFMAFGELVGKVQPSSVAEHRRLFDEHDTAGDAGAVAADGFLSKPQVRDWTAAVGLEPPLADEELGMIVSEGQAGGDGQVDFAWCEYGLRLVRDCRSYERIWLANYAAATGEDAKATWAHGDDLEAKMIEA